MEGHTDPRITGEHVRRLRGAVGAITLVGVVHDHPASTYRASRMVERSAPDVLALELPPMAIPLFEGYARSDREPPAFGGEMSAAIQAAGAGAVEGVDRPTPGFFGRLARDLLRERPSPATVRKVLANAGSVTKHAFLCRIAAVVAERTDVRLEVDFPERHDVDRFDTPEDQARDERTRIRQSRAFLNAFRTSNGTRASRFEDATREEHMAVRLSKLQRDGDVVAVVGIDHLDPLVRRLEERGVTMEGTDSADTADGAESGGAKLEGAADGTEPDGNDP